MTDSVDHPGHYNANPSGVECIDVVEHLPFNIGNAIKYLWRAGQKGDVMEDLQKAAWYVNREMERLTALCRTDQQPQAGQTLPTIPGTNTSCGAMNGGIVCWLPIGHTGSHSGYTPFSSQGWISWPLAETSTKENA